jgi:uncharacterized membrane-anchored protein YitT (DUF2179 family)
MFSNLLQTPLNLWSHETILLSRFSPDTACHIEPKSTSTGTTPDKKSIFPMENTSALKNIAPIITYGKFSFPVCSEMKIYILTYRGDNKVTTWFRNTREMVSIVCGAALVATGFNVFLIPHQLLSGGVSGISMLIGYVTQWNIGWLYFVLNVPLFIWGWIAVGKKFVTLSFLSVAATVVGMQVIPEIRFNQDPILASVFGGVLVGLGTGLSFRAGGSTGGFDIVGFILLRRRDFPLGGFLFALNGSVIIVLGLTQQNWDLALYSMLSIFVTGKVIDVIHTRHMKITAFIVSAKKDEILQRLLSVPRGITIVQTQGGYSQANNHMLMTVTTRYELQGLLKAVREVDPQAFVNMVETVGVMGLFRRE